MNTSFSKPLTVALLLEDAKVAQKISFIFRKIGVVPAFYTSLEKFWFDVLSIQPGLSIVDVKLMSQGNLALKNHPNVMTESLPMVFYYSEKTRPLSFSAYELLNYGLINGSEEIEHQLKVILKRLIKFNENREENDHLRREIKSLENSNSALIVENNKQHMKSELNAMPFEIAAQIEFQIDEMDFEDACASALNSWQDINRYTIFSLSQNKQKMVSPAISSNKFFRVPDLWLGKTCLNGMDKNVQNMAHQVAVDVLGPDAHAIKINSTFVNPEYIIYVDAAENIRKNFNWKHLESLLKGILNRLKVQSLNISANDQAFMGPWDFLGVLDQQISGTSLKKYSVINLNLKEYVDLIRDKVDLVFYWARFYKEFVSGIERSSQIEFKIINYGIDNISLLVNEEFSDELFRSIKSFCGKFNFWKYFEEPELVFANAITPKINMIPASPEAYLSYIKDDKLSYESFNQTVIQRNRRAQKQLKDNRPIEINWQTRELPYHEV